MANTQPFVRGSGLSSATTWTDEGDVPVTPPAGARAEKEASPQHSETASGSISSPSSAPSVNRLGLAHFRNYVSLNCRFGPHLNILVGDNGSGKTNILEAISLLGPGRGLRQANFADLATRDEATQWSIAADMRVAAGDVRVRIDHAGDGRQVQLDGAEIRGMDHLSDLLPQLWLTPAMDRLFVDAASGRRRFLDRFTATLLPGISRAGQAFEKAMRERNRLLSEPGWHHHSVWLDGLEDTMALNGAMIAAARLQAIDALAAGLERLPGDTFPRARIGIEGSLESALRVQAASDVEDQYRSQLSDMRARDAGAGRALDGPHRSDFLVYHMAKNMPAADCSTGEQKALLVGLILAQADTVIARTGDIPILLLDEVAAHLDETRRAALADILVALGGQVWITGTDRRNFTAFERSTDYFSVAHGAIAEAS